MRDGIMEQIEHVPNDVRVLVVASSGIPSLGSFNQFVGRLNHPENWIDCECEDHVPASRLKSRHGLLLLMSSTKGPVVVNMKRAAKTLGIPYLHHALTIGEVKDVLNHLHSKRTVSERKRDVVHSGTNGSSLNGSANHEIEEPSVLAIPSRVETQHSEMPLQTSPVDLMSTLKQMQDLLISEQLLTEDNGRLSENLKTLRISMEEKDNLLKAAKEEAASKERKLIELRNKLFEQKTQNENLCGQLENIRKALESIGGLVASAKRI